MAECGDMTKLKEDSSRVVLIADKGVTMVVMDHQDYTDKAMALLQDNTTYQTINKGPSSKLKNRLISTLKDIKLAAGLTTNKYKQLYPTSAILSKFYGLPKIHKAGTPLRPIVSSRGSVTYGVGQGIVTNH